MPTGDPVMPDEVRRPNHIRYHLTELADIGVAYDTEDEVGILLPDFQ